MVEYVTRLLKIIFIIKMSIIIVRTWFTTIHKVGFQNLYAIQAHCKNI